MAHLVIQQPNKLMVLIRQLFGLIILPKFQMKLVLLVVLRVIHVSLLTTLEYMKLAIQRK